MTNTTNVYAGIIKMDDNADGTLTVYGKATDDSLDIDQQICDPAWLDRAMPEWFMTGGNIREQHSNIAAGVAKEYESKKDGHFISVLVVDPVSVKKVKNNVLRGFSIGIKSPRVVRDQKAANGRIIDGQIVEVSLVDRPANPNCQLILAKSVAGVDTLVKSEELIEKHGDHDQQDHDPRGGGGGDKPSGGGRVEVSNANTTIRETRDRAIDMRADMINAGYTKEETRQAEKGEAKLQSASAKLEDARESKDDEEYQRHVEGAMSDIDDAVGIYSEIDSQEASDMVDNLMETWAGLDEHLADINPEHEPYMGRSATLKTRISERSLMKRNKKDNSIVKEMPMESNPMNGEAKALPSREEMLQRYSAARKALDDVTMECKSYGYDDMDKQYGETAEQETAEGPSVSAETAQEEVSEATGEKPLDKELVDQDGGEMEKSTTKKCLECGCNMPGATHGLSRVEVTGGTPNNEVANVSTATMISPDQTPKNSTITPLPTIEEVGTIIEEEDSDGETSTDKSLLADVNLNDIIEKAVKSAMSSVEAQVAELKSAKEAVENKATKLESELATAKSLAIGGGPKRATIATGATTTNEWKAKADLYFAKASSTTDNVLAKGYRDMAKDFLAKSNPVAETK
jgi:hypothetical protein